MGHRVGASLRYSLLLSVPVWCAVLAEANAACTTRTPAAGQTVTCTGTDTNSGVQPAAGTENVTVNVVQGATINGTPQPSTAPYTTRGAVYVFNNGVVNNAGTINPTVGATTYGVALSGSNATLTNTGTISLTGPGTGTARTIYGVIATVPQTLQDAGTTFSNVSVQNYGTISLTQNGAGTARAVYSGEAIDSMVVDNYGTISVTKVGNATSTNGIAGIDSDDDTDDLKVHNHAGATISATGGNTYAVGGRARDYDLTNDGTISSSGSLTYLRNTSLAATPSRETTTLPGAAIVIYGPGDADIENTKKGVINGDVWITDLSPINPNAGQAGNDYTRNSEFENHGVINGSFHYGNGTHVLENEGTITGSISVDQRVPISGQGGNPVVASGYILPGGASFTLTNSGTIGGDISIIDRADSVNQITLIGTGFGGNIVTTGAGDNTLTLRGVTSLASVQNFTNLYLTRSNVTVPGGVSLVPNATLGTTVYGFGGTRAAPSTQLGTINGTLTLAGPTTLKPNFTGLVRNGDVYQVASAVTGPGAADITVQQKQTALLRNARVDTSDGRLLLTTQVRDARTISGISQPAGATLQSLLTYNGNNPAVLRLGAAVENLRSEGAVRNAGNALSPITNGADVQSPINATMLFHQQIDSRLDSYIFAQIPVSGRSADLGVARPVYGVLPPSAGWIEAIGGGAHQSSVNGVSGYTAELAGVIGGYDRLITPNIRVGGAFGYIGTRVNGNDSGGRRENIQTYQGLVYGELDQRNYYLRGSAGYGGVDFQNSRQISFPGFNDIAFGKHGGDIFTARGEGGVPVEYRNSLLIPYAAFTYSRLHQNAYQEQSANGAALSYQSARNNSERSEIGGKVLVPLVNAPIFSRLFPVGSFVALEARAAYVHEFGNVAQTVSASFAGAGGIFVAAGPVPNRDMVDYGVGLRMGRGPVQIDISYNGLARSTYLQQVGLIRARYMF